MKSGLIADGNPCAAGGTRTPTRVAPQRILSPWRLPFRHGGFHARHGVKASHTPAVQPRFFRSLNPLQTPRTNACQIRFALKNAPPPSSLPATHHSRRGGRVVDCAGLENRRAARSRGFESHPLRHFIFHPTFISPLRRIYP